MSIIRLTTCASSIEANMLQGLLANEGIESFLTNENFTTLMPGFNGMLGSGVQVMIEETDFERASKLIQEEVQEDEIRCPECNSTNVSFGLGQNKYRKILAAFFSFLAGTPLGNIKSTHYCRDCMTDFSRTTESE
ncbi:MAG: DUF2007 domain-containing protein [Bacteroidales bacterium]|nr:DUF2007 domain-containing protein [Bacteroidales bacterium]